MSVEVTRLDNGLMVVSDRMPHLETVSLGIWVNAGARSESATEHGLAHLLEHMAFKGTRRRSALAIAAEIEAVGGDLNAATGFEQTAYYARVLKDDIALAVDILADILQHSTFDEHELAKEQSVILQEIKAARDTPDDLVFDLFQEVAFPHQPLGRSILGTPQTVRGFGAADLRRYLGERYAAPTMVLAAAGAVSHRQLVELAAGQLGGLPNKPMAPSAPASYLGGEKRLTRTLEQAHLVMGVEGLSYQDEDFFAAQVLCGILGGGMSSRLFQEVREKRGLCYSIYAFHWAFSDTGLFGVYAATGESDLGALAPVVLDELRRACDDIGEAETATSRAQLKAGLVLALESSAARAEQIARQQLVYGRVVPVQDLIDKVEAVSAERARRVATRLFSGASLSLTTLGPMAKLDSYDKLASRLA